jgi:hypothetical protein
MSHDGERGMSPSGRVGSGECSGQHIMMSENEALCDTGSTRWYKSEALSDLGSTRWTLVWV